MLSAVRISRPARSVIARTMSSFDIGPTQTVKDAIKTLEDRDVPVSAHVSMANQAAEGDLSKCPVLSSNEYLMRSAQRESNARTYVRRFPFAIKEADGIMLTDTDGKQYYDCLGCAGTLALGHNHPVIKDAILKFMDSKAPLQVLDMATPEKDTFVTKLFGVLPEELASNGRIHFCSPAGTDALDAAVKLCKTATGRRTVLSFHGGYHGHGHGTLAMMGNLGAKTPITGLMSDVHFLPYPYHYRNPFGLKGEAGEEAVLNYIETVLDDVESGITTPACVVMEAIQGEGGVNAASVRAMRRIRELTAERGIPLVVDEVQAGFCRSGDFFAFNQSGIVPDVVCMSKAVGGSQPLAVVAYKKELDTWGPGAHTGTFRGSQISLVCGSASIDYMNEVRLWEHAAARGQQLQANLARLAEEVPCVGDIRGRGLMTGLELVDETKPVDRHGLPPPDGDLAARTQVECVKRGMIMERGGRGGAVMRFLAPLIISESEIDVVSGIFADAVKAAHKALRK